MAELSERQHGIVVGRQLRELGLTRSAIRNEARRGLLIRLTSDIYRLRDHPSTWESQLQAMLFDVGPTGFVSHRAAARLHGFRKYRTSTAIEVTGKEQHDHRVSLGRLHRSSRLIPSHIKVVAGFPVATVARTCFDLMGDPEPALKRSPVGLEVHARDMTRVVNDELARGLTLGQLVAVRVELCRRGRPGSALARQVVDRLSESYEPTTTDGEHLFAELLDIYELAQARRQVPISGRDGFIGTVDFFYPEIKLVIEIDGKTHQRPLDREADALRDARMAAAGYDVWRIPYLTLLRRPETVVRELRPRLRAAAA